MKTILVVALLLLTGCHSTYHIQLDQMQKLQRSQEKPVPIVTLSGESKEFNKNARGFVYTKQGHWYRFSAFNFEMRDQKLYFPEDGAIVNVTDLRESVEITQYKPIMTGVVIGCSVGAVVTAATIIAIVLTTSTGAPSGSTTVNIE